MGFFIKVKSSIKVAEATTSITVELGDTFFNPTSPLMQIIMKSVGEQWNKIELRLLDFMSSENKDYYIGCFQNRTFPIGYKRNYIFVSPSEERKKNNKDLFGTDLFDLRQFQHYYGRWNSRGILQIHSKVHQGNPCCNLRMLKQFSFYVNNPKHGVRDLRFIFLINDVPVYKGFTDAFHFIAKPTSLVTWHMLSPRWVCDPPIKVVVPYNKYHMEEAYALFNYYKKETPLPSKILRFNASYLTETNVDHYRLFILATNIFLQIFELPGHIQNEMIQLVQKDRKLGQYRLGAPFLKYRAAARYLDESKRRKLNNASYLSENDNDSYTHFYDFEVSHNDTSFNYD